MVIIIKRYFYRVATAIKITFVTIRSNNYIRKGIPWLILINQGKGFHLLRMSNDYCFRRAVQGQLSQCNMRNTATVLRAVVISHKILNGEKVFAFGCSESLKKFSKRHREELLLESFCFNVAAWNSLYNENPK